MLLKTQTNNFKQRYIILMGNELYFQKKKDSETHEFMHQLIGTFVELKDPVQHCFAAEEDENEKEEQATFYPLKVVLGP